MEKHMKIKHFSETEKDVPAPTSLGARCNRKVREIFVKREIIWEKNLFQ